MGRRAPGPPKGHAGRMILNGEALEDFKRRYENVFSIRLSDEEARELEASLKHLYRIVRRRSAARGAARTGAATVPNAVCGPKRNGNFGGMIRTEQGLRPEISRS